MKRTMLMALFTAIAGCSQSDSNDAVQADTISFQVQQNNKADTNSTKGIIKTGEKLIYQGATFSSFTEETQRGDGVISIRLDINDRLDIWDMDGAKFGEIVLNEDQTFFTLNMPKKVIARNVVPEFDFAAFDFDAEDPASDPRYLLIYVNHEKRKVEKQGLKYDFRTHQQYRDDDDGTDRD
ncbi:hypothetical protein LJ707_02595 [Mucilaginibacter sp. UR6-1]|uniref:hypothetical protein n=1 Tax=Mucilaginibacter sp. UR6-1 TaxID=1435643 RepID=UPI001E35C364|nr:hypothetical protein [Mucilaginibacter sp. UR6-1]MCC8407802.1 hypothetical protein [Mucilaginibacter sp. UR6-1]